MADGPVVDLEAALDHFTLCPESFKHQKDVLGLPCPGKTTSWAMAFSLPLPRHQPAQRHCDPAESQGAWPLHCEPSQQAQLFSPGRLRSQAEVCPDQAGDQQ